MNTSKIILASAALLLSASTLAAYQLYSRTSLQAEQIANYESYVSDLQFELDEFAEQRVGYESRIAELSRELVIAEDAARGLNEDLELAREMISPDVYLMEQEIRERVIREVEVQQGLSQTPSRYDVQDQLSKIDRDEMRRITSMQSSYGEFLAALDVSDERREVIVDALIDLMADQQQQRRELFSQPRELRGDRREVRRQLAEITSPDAQSVAMSYVLDEAEMAVFDAFQEEQRLQREQRRTSTSTLTTNSSGNAVRINEITTRDASGQVETRVIEMVSPDRPTSPPN